MPEEGLVVDLDSPIPQPDPAPAPAPELPAPDQIPVTPEPTVPVPEAAPEAPVDTGWVDGSGQQPEPPPQQPQQYQPPPPQYQQPPPQPPQQPPQGYGNDVDSYIREKANEVMQQNLGPIAMQVQQYHQATNAHVTAVADTELSRAEFITKQADRNELSKDKGYRESEQVRDTVRGNIKQWINDGHAEALRGDPRKLLAVHNPNFFQGVLAISKIHCGYQPNPIAGPATPAGAVVESATPPQVVRTTELPSDLEDLAQARGPAYRAHLIKSLQETEEAGDFDVRS